jgi:hypothetical protein
MASCAAAAGPKIWTKLTTLLGLERLSVHPAVVAGDVISLAY